MGIIRAMNGKLDGSLRLGCSSPVIVLIPSSSTLASPLQFRRNQDFYISSFIQLRCNQSSAIVTQWTLHNCTRSSSVNCSSSSIPLGLTVDTRFSEIYLPSRTLAFGLYELKLTVIMTNLPHLFSSMSAYVQINPSGITANLIQFGTSMITRGHEQDLNLDPGTFSEDFDENTFNSTVSVHPCRASHRRSHSC